MVAYMSLEFHPQRIRMADIISHDNITDILKVFRNLVHIAKKVKENLVSNEAHAKHALTSVEVIIAEVRSWYENKVKQQTATP